MKNQPVKSDTKWEMTKKLYKIRNIANLAVLCPQQDAEIWILQDMLEHISDMIQAIIEELEESGG